MDYCKIKLYQTVLTLLPQVSYSFQHLRNKLKLGSSKFTNRDLIYIMFLEYRIYGLKTHLAQFSRLGHPKTWCSEQHVQQEGEWLQVDLGVVRKIFSIGTKVVLL